MKHLITLTCILAACAGARAADPAAKTAPAAAANAAAPSAYTPKTKSLFTASGNEHNPFWPIGWVKTATASSDSAPVVPHADDFSVTTILLNDPPMAVINGKEMAEGEVQVLSTPSGNVTVQLMAVQDGRVVLRWENQNLTVAIHRDELTQAR